uniref:CTLH domain-containing protein n=1 Tax=Rhabditophanes sp. KR3021 TaxID=114890 RepID=A0AC35TQ35_9BILA
MKEYVATIQALFSEGKHSEAMKMYESLKDKMAIGNEHFHKAVSEEKEMGDLMLTRYRYIVDTCKAPDQLKFIEERNTRMVIEELYRSNKMAAAEYLSWKSSLSDMVNTDLYKEYSAINQGLESRDLGPAFVWVNENKSKLKKIDSRMEVELKIQACIEILRLEKLEAAIDYCRINFSNVPKDKWHGNLLHLMGLLVSTGKVTHPEYIFMLSDFRWDFLKNYFNQEYKKVFHLDTPSAFSLSLQVGLAVLKTPHCKKTPFSKCPTCDVNAFEIAYKLPHATCLNSRIIDRYNALTLNDNNIPMMLPDGTVYGKYTIDEFTKDGFFHDPLSNEKHPLENILKLFVL